MPRNYTIATDLLTGDVKLAHDGGAFTVNLAAFPAEIIAKLALHGFKQKVNDSMAGMSADEVMPVDVAQSFVDRFARGDWTPGRVGASRTVDPLQVFLRNEATLAARAKLRSLGRSAKPADVKPIREKFLAHVAWVAATTARFVPPADLDVNIDDEPEAALAA